MRVRASLCIQVSVREDQSLLFVDHVRTQRKEPSVSHKATVNTTCCGRHAHLTPAALKEYPPPPTPQSPVECVSSG